MSRYGESRFPLPRKVIARGIVQQPVLELCPPRLKVFLLTAVESEMPDDPSYSHIIVSSADTLSKLSKELVAEVSSDPQRPCRIWRLASTNFDRLHYPSSKLMQDGAALLKASDETLEEALIEPDDSFVVELQQNGKWIVDASEVPLAAISGSIQNGIPQPLFHSGSDFFSRLEDKLALQPTLKPEPSPSTSKKSLKPPQLKVGIARPSLATSFQHPKSNNKATQQPGTIGLGNM